MSQCKGSKRDFEGFQITTCNFVLDDTACGRRTATGKASNWGIITDIVLDLWGIFNGWGSSDCRNVVTESSSFLDEGVASDVDCASFTVTEMSSISGEATADFAGDDELLGDKSYWNCTVR